MHDLKPFCGFHLINGLSDSKQNKLVKLSSRVDAILSKAKSQSQNTVWTLSKSHNHIHMGGEMCGRSMQGSPAIQTKVQMDPSVYDALKTMTVSQTLIYIYIYIIAYLNI